MAVVGERDGRISLVPEPQLTAAQRGAVMGQVLLVVRPPKLEMEESSVLGTGNSGFDI